MWSYELHEIKRKRLGRLLCEIRVDLGLRQQDLADQLGQPQSFVSKYETACRRLDLAELETICEALGITVAHLAQRYETRNDNSE